MELISNHGSKFYANVVIAGEFWGTMNRNNGNFGGKNITLLIYKFKARLPLLKRSAGSVIIL
jgi:hypothetical protein